MKSIGSLEKLQNFFGVGRIVINKRYDNHKEHLAQYVVNRRSELLETIIPFFEQYKLLTTKQYDFESFKTCIRKMEHDQHLMRSGLVEIIKIAETMNHKKSRSSLIRILRD